MSIQLLNIGFVIWYLLTVLWLLLVRIRPYKADGSRCERQGIAH